MATATDADLPQGEPAVPTRLAPGPKGFPVIGCLPQMQRQGILPFFVEQWQHHGDIFRLRIGPINQHVVVHPEYVHHVLVANNRNYVKGVGLKKIRLALGNGLFVSDGKTWQQQRRLMQPPFTAKGVQAFAPVMHECTQQMIDRWAARPHPEAILDVNQEMMRLAMDIIATAMFDYRVGSEAERAASAFRYVLEFASERSAALVDWPLFVPTRANRRFRAAMDLLRGYISDIIQQARANGSGKRNLLNMLIDARDEESGQGMSEAQLRDEVITIFFAGHETTAQALTWTWYLLSEHPEVEARLHEELDSVLAGRAPTVADVPRLTYTRKVFQEAMRLYPPIMFFVRDAVGPDRIDGCSIPPSSMVMLAPYLTHRDPRWWPDPERFDPERFTDEAISSRPQYAYFPFGGGPRTCLGDKFAMLEGEIVLATVAQQYRLRVAEGHVVRPSFLGTLRPEGGMPMRLEPR